jgi:hypothetical protein
MSDIIDRKLTYGDRVLVAHRANPWALYDFEATVVGFTVTGKHVKIRCWLKSYWVDVSDVTKIEPRSNR